MLTVLRSPRPLSAFLLSLAALLSLQPQLAIGASKPSLSRMSVKAGDLGAGFKLQSHGHFASHVSGQTSGSIWTYTHSASSKTPAIVKLVNWVAHFNKVTAAAEDVLIAFGRTCGGHQQNFSYHGISAEIGDNAEGCYYPITFKGKRNSPAVTLVLRRYSYVTEVRAYGTRALGDQPLEGLVEHLAAIVDRRIEIAQNGTPSQGTTKGSNKPFVRISRCKSPCFFAASGRGSTMAPVRYRGSPTAFQFSAPPIFKVTYKYDCAHSIPDRQAFDLILLDDSGASRVLKGEPYQRNHGVLIAGLGTGARRAVLQLVVQNDSCTWSVKASKYSGNNQP